jgi:hypothetical protein
MNGSIPPPTNIISPNPQTNPKSGFMRVYVDLCGFIEGGGIYTRLAKPNPGFWKFFRKKVGKGLTQNYTYVNSLVGKD